MCCRQARYDGELQVYLKATGLQASDLVKAKVKKSKTASAGKSASHTSSPSHGDAIKPAADNYSDTVNGSESVSAAYVNAANGFAAGTTLPHFSQVWSSTAQDVVYNADQLLAQMTVQAGNGQAGLYHGSNTGTADGTRVLLTADGSQHLQPAVFQYVCFYLFHVLSVICRSIISDLSLNQNNCIYPSIIILVKFKLLILLLCIITVSYTHLTLPTKRIV